MKLCAFHTAAAAVGAGRRQLSGAQSENGQPTREVGPASGCRHRRRLDSIHPRHRARCQRQPGLSVGLDDVGRCAARVLRPFNALGGAERRNPKLHCVAGESLGKQLKCEPYGRRHVVSHGGFSHGSVDRRNSNVIGDARTSHAHRLVLVKILVLGSGAREHAIILSLRAETDSHDITAAPGNAGIARDVTCATFDITDPVIVANVAIEMAADLVVIGPEAPLVAGVADELREQGIPVFGPGKAAAQLEGSKTFAKRVMDAAGVPSGRATRATSLAEVESALDAFGSPYVVKADGLAAGKGVLVTHDRDAARDHARAYLPHGSILVEEFLEGQEVSLFLLSDGHRVLPLSPAQDYKRLGDGDAGPNTGGMGAYSPLPWLDETFGSEEAFVDEVIRTVAQPVITQLAEDQTPFIGLLYAGLILTSKRDNADDSGIRVIEFNARFGDPETQVVLPRLATPLSQLLLAAATGTLDDSDRPEFSMTTAVTVVLASENYPAKPITGRQITGLDAAEAIEGVHIAHAATTDAGGRLTASGGRVLNVVALGTTFSEARERAYDAIGLIELEGAQYRSDIARCVAD